MIVLVLLLVLVLLPVLVLHDFSAGGLYSYSCEWRCQHLRCDSVCKHDFFEPFFGLSKILLHFNPPVYLYFVSSPGLWLCVPPCRQLWESRSHLCQVPDPVPSPRCTTWGTPLSRTSWKRLCSLKHCWNYYNRKSKGRPCQSRTSWKATSLSETFGKLWNQDVTGTRFTLSRGFFFWKV